jgi:intracellular sulfur oxidation DsrE/DsrF family protein
MQKYDQLDDDMLSAFVDGQLDPTKCELVIDAMEKDSSVRERVYKMRRAKDLIKLGFGNAKAPTRTPFRFKTSWWYPDWFGLATSALILVALLGAGSLGYFGGKHFAGETTANVPMALNKMDRVLLHISESEPKQFAAALDYTREFLEKHKNSGGQIAVIANAGGLDLLREGVSPFEEQVIAMIRDYDNVHFIACANSIRALRKKGIKPVIIENIDSTLPAMDQIIKHVQQGWTYIKVKTLIKT